MPRWTIPTQLPGELLSSTVERLITELNNVLAEIDQRFIDIEPHSQSTEEAE